VPVSARWGRCRSAGHCDDLFLEGGREGGKLVKCSLGRRVCCREDDGVSKSIKIKVQMDESNDPFVQMIVEKEM